MRTLYCIAIIKISTGEVRYCVTSTSPLPDKDLIEVPIATRTEYFTLEIANNDNIRAKDLLPDLTFAANQLSIKANAVAGRVLSGITIDNTRQRLKPAVN